MLKFKNFLICSIVLLFTQSALATGVDGYKNIKFGMNKATVEKSGICSFYTIDSRTPSTTAIGCDDFSFSGSTTSLLVYFFDNKVSRVGVIIPNNQLIATMNSLVKKYGATMLDSSTAAQWSALDSYPNQQADALWLDRTVGLRGVSNADRSQTFILLYSVRNYDYTLEQRQTQAINNNDI